jgi:hypothetical protein
MRGKLQGKVGGAPHAFAVLIAFTAKKLIHLYRVSRAWHLDLHVLGWFFLSLRTSL